MAGVVYVLCFLTSLICAILLLRGYKQSGSRLLLWSALAFAGFAVNNGMLFVDRIVMPGSDLYLARTLPALIGLLLLLYGLIWEAD